MGHPSFSCSLSASIQGFVLWLFVYPRRLLWCSGVLILLLMISPLFLATFYVGTDVILGCYRNNQASNCIPIFGQQIVVWFGVVFL
jgi:quinol-cytochrome oxidoreductase complex cytochrome b subunit